MSKETPTVAEYIMANPWIGPFVPRAHVVWDGEALEYYSEGVPCYTKQVDANLWIYYAIDDDRVVGAKIFGLPDAIKRATPAEGG